MKHFSKRQILIGSILILSFFLIGLTHIMMGAFPRITESLLLGVGAFTVGSTAGRILIEYLDRKIPE
jgi:4-hydroxybenzoate polyprenyltransferase